MAGDLLAESVRKLSPRQLAWLEAHAPAEDMELIRVALDSSSDLGWRSDAASMAHRLTGGRYELWPFVRLLARELRAAVEGVRPRQMWNMPSQYGKTTLLGVWGPLWILDRDPTARIMFVSYDADKAQRESMRARDLAEEHAGMLRFRLRADARAKGQWITEQGGGLYATGVNGAITGYSADVLLLDDLLKGWQAAHSAAVREFVWEVWRSQLRLRTQRVDTPIIASGTRWHVDDYFARIGASGDVWHRVVLPALAEEGDPLGRALGEPLEPSRFPAEEVRARKRVLGSYLWNALEQQRPAPEEGGEIKRAWFRWSSQPPAGWDEMVSSWDMKLKDKEAGDYLVGQVWCRSGSLFHLVDQLRGQWPQAVARAAIALTAVRHPGCRVHLVENTGYGPELIDELRAADPGYSLSTEVGGLLGVTPGEADAVTALIRRGVPGVKPVSPRGSKEVRTRMHSGLIEAGNVVLPEWLPGAAVLVDECAAFPNGAHDDTVDAMTQALAGLRGSGTDYAAPTPGGPGGPLKRQRRQLS